jgi:SPP1 gp7 family putative phage head morphogenesis protein
VAVPPSLQVALGLIQSLVRSAPESIRRKAHRARRARAVVPNHRVELNYLADLLLIVEACRRAGAEVEAGLRVHWDEFVPLGIDARALDILETYLLNVLIPRSVVDAPPPPPGAPSEAPGLDVLLEQAARRFGNIDAVAERLAKLAAQRALGAVDEALAESLQKAVGVDISSYLGPDSDIRAALADAVEANVVLIKSIPTQYLDDIRATVSKAFARGERFESVAKLIAHVGDVTESRAALIARDQISKMNASFNEVRQASVGITHYVWSTSRDERVRPSHRALNGETFAWAKPPEVDGEHVNPGEAINCRCVALPVIDMGEQTGGGETEERQAA